MTKINRRTFLSEAVQKAMLAGSASKILIPAMLDGLLSSQFAHAQTTLPRRYVSIFLYGAPTRHMFDLFLDPYNSGNFQSNPYVGNSYVAENGRYTSAEYKFWTHEGLRLPWMWQFTVPSSSGGERPMTDLLPHLFALQGITTENAGHPGSQLLHSLHSTGSSSLAALAADGVERDIPAVAVSLNSSSGFGWKSKKSKEVARLGGSNLLTSLMSPFTRPISGGIQNRILVNANPMKAAMDEMNQIALAGDTRAQVILDSADATKNMMAKASEDLTTIWSQLLTKYQDLIRRAIQPSTALAGLSDLPIGSSDIAARSALGIYNMAAAPLEHSDLRSLIGNETVIADMAESFAIAEYLFERDMTYSVMINPKAMSKILNSAGAASITHGFDEHTTGIMPVVYLNTMYFRATSACLLEFIDRLKVFGIFNETILDLSQDFHRSPGKTGSDHGFSGKSVTLISGAIANGPFIRGNTISNGPGSTPGTWGTGGDVKDILGNNLGRIKIPHLHATIAYLLRAQNPVTTATSLVELNGAGQLSSILETYRLIRT